MACAQIVVRRGVHRVGATHRDTTGLPRTWAVGEQRIAERHGSLPGGTLANYAAEVRRGRAATDDGMSIGHPMCGRRGNFGRSAGHELSFSRIYHF